jgi:hypothetical protein
MAALETPAFTGVSTFAPLVRAGFQTGVRFTMKHGVMMRFRQMFIQGEKR